MSGACNTFCYVGCVWSPWHNVLLGNGFVRFVESMEYCTVTLSISFSSNKRGGSLKKLELMNRTMMRPRCSTWFRCVIVGLCCYENPSLLWVDVDQWPKIKTLFFVLKVIVLIKRVHSLDNCICCPIVLWARNGKEVDSGVDASIPGPRVYKGTAADINP